MPGARLGRASGSAVALKQLAPAGRPLPPAGQAVSHDFRPSPAEWQKGAHHRHMHRHNLDLDPHPHRHPDRDLDLEPESYTEANPDPIP